MITVKGRNAQQILPEVMHQLINHPLAVRRNSRNGPVIQFIEPVTIQYQRPLERVVFWEERDANPFFHFFESLWMLGGRNDVAYVSKFSSNIGQFSDDGRTFHGAYGARWRKHFRRQGGQQYLDQLPVIAKALKDNPEDRRQVLQMWSAEDDLGRNGKDLPCNVVASFNRNHVGALNMSVFNRSNDILWGALGANCVHFSYLQEYLAACIGCEVGQYWQISTNMHGYTELTPLLNACLPLGESSFPSMQYKHLDPYQAGQTKTFPLVNGSVENWNADLEMFLEMGANAIGYRDRFFRRLANPMLRAYEAFSERNNPNRFDAALTLLDAADECDWSLAGRVWLERRAQKAQEKAVVQVPMRPVAPVPPSLSPLDQIQQDLASQDERAARANSSPLA